MPKAKLAKSGVVIIDGDRITRIVEKPKPEDAPSNLAVVGRYILTPRIFDLLTNLPRGAGNEIQLTDGIAQLLQTEPVLGYEYQGKRYDCGSKESLLETNAVLLQKEFPNAPAGNYPNTIIIPPVSIAPNCKISNSIIGPMVSIGDNTIIRYSILSDSIIGSFAQLENAVLHHSVIGSDASLRGLSQSLNLGDNTQIDFG